jgi:hypothetical protein
MSVDTELANSLLNKKYDNDASVGNIQFNPNQISTDYPKFTLPNPNKPVRPNVPFPPQNTSPQIASNKEVDWKFLAQERLQIITEFQDAKNAWWEAWKLEKERADRLEAKLFSYMSGFVEGVQEIKEEQEIQKLQQEVKHTISSPAQINRKRANWPSVKAQLEKKFSLSESAQNTQETEDKGE